MLIPVARNQAAVTASSVIIYKPLSCYLCSLVKSQNAPKKLPKGFAGWIMPTCKLTETELIRFAGTDAATYLRVQSFGKFVRPMPLLTGCACFS